MQLDQELPANPSSIHWFGRRAKNLLTSARETLATFFSANLEEITFTSGATESLNLLLRGLDKGHIITTNIEHSAIFETLKSLDSDVTYLNVGSWGAPTPEMVIQALRPDTKAIILSLANAETGVKIDLDGMNKIAIENKVPLLLDGVAYIGKEPFKRLEGIKAVAISGHKIHGPKGIGALYMHKSLKIHPSLTGGPQEKNIRAGTENLTGILGLQKAVEILMGSQDQITKHLITLRDRFESLLKSFDQKLVINGEGPRVANTSNICFPGVDGEMLLIEADLAGLAISHGSACSSGMLEPSRVLINMGFNRKRAGSSIRITFSRMNTIDEVENAAQILIEIIKKVPLR